MKISVVVGGSIDSLDSVTCTCNAHTRELVEKKGI